MSRYVRKFIDNCVTCKVAKSHSGKVQARLHPIPKVGTPWHTIHVDATGRLSGKSDQKEYVFVIIDAFTKYVLLFHTVNIDSKSSIKAVKDSVALFGTPTRIIADQGRCFASKEFKEFCDSSNINLHLISTGSSRANGQAKFNLQLTARLTGLQKLASFMGSLELLIGKVARPLSLMAADDVEPEVNLNIVRDNALRNIESAASYEKRRFDQTKAKFNKFSVGDFVLIMNEERNQTKLDQKFKGPFEVIEVLEGDRYNLKALNCNRTYKYAHDKLRKMPENQSITDEIEEEQSSCDAEESI
ncbi:unnamed protein product [Euphydryas editha]|uniref:Integrase catalytic domain-containing protein n=1 Tax=Euphydryas editha TaxID=104508 RepID=A0AAU9TWC1_EUPED|nr:unnamed protein product [Euphydryas editha]